MFYLHTSFIRLLRVCSLGMLVLSAPTLCLASDYGETGPRVRKKKGAKGPTVEDLEARIESLRKSIMRFEHQIEYYNFKIHLHNECRGCHAHCRPQGTGACRHWWDGKFEGKNYRASHQMPSHGKKRYDGINRAVSALQLRIDGCKRNIAMLEGRIAKLEAKIRELESSSDDD